MQEIACFSYDDKHQFRLDASSVRYYYPPYLPVDLNRGFDTFHQLDDTNDDHLDGLVDTIAALEEEKGTKVEADIITWRGMMTKVGGFFGRAGSTMAYTRVDYGGTFLSNGWLGDERNMLPGFYIP
jgi:hypothetical protein